jgi:predicted amidohydrolase YtcJ
MAARLTTYVVVAIVAATFIAGLIVGAQRDDSSGPVDLIVYNAKLYAADPLGSMAEAVAVRGNTILHVGSNREILRYRRPQTTVIDAKGAAVVPGFNDAHAHFMEAALSKNEIDLRDAKSLEEILQRVQDWADAHPDAAWIAGRGWSSTRLLGAPSRSDLDDIVPDRPIVLWSDEGRTAWVNTKALRTARVTRTTGAPRGGSIVRDLRTGEPTGILKDAASALVTSAMPRTTADERARALRLAIRTAHEHGITSVQDVDSSPEDLETYDAARRSEELTLRLYAGTTLTPASESKAARTLEDVTTQYAEDAVLKTGLAHIPLADPGVTRDAPAVDPDDLARLVATIDKQGWQAAIDARSEEAVRLALDAYAAVSEKDGTGARQRRHRIDAIGEVDVEDVGRFRNLAATLIAPGPAAGDLRASEVELSRSLIRVPAESLAKAGAHLSFGTDWPRQPLNPMAALSRIVRTESRNSHADARGSDEREPTDSEAEGLALKSAINAWTSGGAWASFDEHRKGMLKPGMLADMVVLSRDVFKANREQLEATEVVATIFDGRVVYRRDLRPGTN